MQKREKSVRSWCWTNGSGILVPGAIPQVRPHSWNKELHQSWLRIWIQREGNEHDDYLGPHGHHWKKSPRWMWQGLGVKVLHKSQISCWYQKKEGKMDIWPGKTTDTYTWFQHRSYEVREMEVQVLTDQEVGREANQLLPPNCVEEKVLACSGLCCSLAVLLQASDWPLCLQTHISQSKCYKPCLHQGPPWYFFHCPSLLQKTHINS